MWGVPSPEKISHRSSLEVLPRADGGGYSHDHVQRHIVIQGIRNVGLVLHNLSVFPSATCRGELKGIIRGRVSLEFQILTVQT